MERQSFARWRLPRELGAVLLRDDHRDGHRFGSTERHFHDELELHFIDRGHGVLLVPGGRLSIAPGTLVWIPPGRDHLLLEASADFRRWMLLARPRLVRRALPERSLPGLLGRSAREASGLLPKAAMVVLQALYENVAPDRKGDVSLFNAGVAFLLARSFQLFEAGGARPVPVALHRAVVTAVRALREDEARPSLPELAALAGVTESHLSKLFSVELGVSVTDFRNRLGIERFLEAYGDGSRATILDAALRAGFGSYPQFHRVFRKEMGYSPAEHRRRARRLAPSARKVRVP